MKWREITSNGNHQYWYGQNTNNCAYTKPGGVGIQCFMLSLYVLSNISGGHQVHAESNDYDRTKMSMK